MAQLLPRPAAAGADRDRAGATTATCAPPCSASTRRAASTASAAPTRCPRSTPPPAPAARAIAGEGDAPAITSNRFEVGASVASFELDFWGRVRSLTESARANYLSTIHAQRVVPDQPDRRRRRRLPHRARTRRADHARRGRGSSRTRALEIGKLRLDAGVTSALDYRKIETLLTQAMTERANLELQRAEARNALEFLVGGPVAAPLPAPLPLESQGIVENIAPGLPSELLANRPDILEAEEQLARRQCRRRRGARRLLPADQPDRRAGIRERRARRPVRAAAAFPGTSAPMPRFRSSTAAATAATSMSPWPATASPSPAMSGPSRTRSARSPTALARRKWLVDRLASQRRGVAAQRARAELARLRYAMASPTISRCSTRCANCSPPSSRPKQRGASN